jgi:hypothetical protein
VSVADRHDILGIDARFVDDEADSRRLVDTAGGRLDVGGLRRDRRPRRGNGVVRARFNLTAPEVPADSTASIILANTEFLRELQRVR